MQNYSSNRIFYLELNVEYFWYITSFPLSWPSRLNGHRSGSFKIKILYLIYGHNTNQPIHCRKEINVFNYATFEVHYSRKKNPVMYLRCHKTLLTHQFIFISTHDSKPILCNLTLVPRKSWLGSIIIPLPNISR